MLLSLALFALCSTSQPGIVVEPAGFLRDTRVFCENGKRFRLETMIQSPVVLSRREFLIEGTDSQGRVLFTQRAYAQGNVSPARTPRWVATRLDCQLPEAPGLAGLRVRLAR